jgi:hypothetical protein
MAGYAAGAAWRRNFDSAAYRAAIRRANEEPIPRPLALLVQVPTARYPRAANDSAPDTVDWLPCLEREIELHTRSIAPDRHLARVLVSDPGQRLPTHGLRRLLGRAADHLRSRPDKGQTSLRGLDIIGLGPGAIGRVERCLARNIGDPDAYCAALERDELPVADGCQLGGDGLALGDLVATLIDEASVDLEALSAEHGFDLGSHFAAKLAALPETHVQRQESRLLLTAVGITAPDVALQALLAGECARSMTPAGAWQPRLIRGA